MIRLAGIVLMLACGPVLAMTGGSTLKQPADKAHLGSMNGLSNDEFLSRCYSLSHAIYFYRKIMRFNPVHGENPRAGMNLDWVDDLQIGLRNADVDFGEGAMDYMDDYIQVLGPVSTEIDLAKFPRITLDKQSCLKKYGTGNE